MQEILQRVQAMPFESLEKMELYITEKLSQAFPKISFQEKEGQEVLADMGVVCIYEKRSWCWQFNMKLTVSSTSS